MPFDLDNLKHYISNQEKRLKEDEKVTQNESIVTPTVRSSTEPTVSSNNGFLQEFLSAAVFY